MADLVEHVRLGQLRLRKRRGHLQQRLPGQHDPPFRYGPHVPREIHTEQGLKIPGWPVQGGSEGIDVLRTDMQAGQVVQSRLQPRRDQESALGRQIADEEAEGRLAGHALP